MAIYFVHLESASNEMSFELVRVGTECIIYGCVVWSRIWFETLYSSEIGIRARVIVVCPIAFRLVLKRISLCLVQLAGGYYVIEQARLQLHLVALNTNYYSEVNHATAENEEMDPGGQWAWLESILLKARRRRGTVSRSWTRRLHP